MLLQNHVVPASFYPVAIVPVIIGKMDFGGEMSYVQEIRRTSDALDQIDPDN